MTILKAGLCTERVNLLRNHEGRFCVLSELEQERKSFRCRKAGGITPSLTMGLVCQGRETSNMGRLYCLSRVLFPLRPRGCMIVQRSSIYINTTTRFPKISNIRTTAITDPLHSLHTFLILSSHLPKPSSQQQL